MYYENVLTAAKNINQVILRIIYNTIYKYNTNFVFSKE